MYGLTWKPCTGVRPAGDSLSGEEVAAIAAAAAVAASLPATPAEDEQVVALGDAQADGRRSGGGGSCTYRQQRRPG